MSQGYTQRVERLHDESENLLSILGPDNGGDSVRVIGTVGLVEEWRMTPTACGLCAPRLSGGWALGSIRETLIPGSEFSCGR